MLNFCCDFLFLKDSNNILGGFLLLATSGGSIGCGAMSVLLIQFSYFSG